METPVSILVKIAGWGCEVIVCTGISVYGEIVFVWRNCVCGYVLLEETFSRVISVLKGQTILYILVPYIVICLPLLIMSSLSVLHIFCRSLALLSYDISTFFLNFCLSHA